MNPSMWANFLELLDRRITVTICHNDGTDPLKVTGRVKIVAERLEGMVIHLQEDHVSRRIDGEANLTPVPLHGENVDYYLFTIYSDQ